MILDKLRRNRFHYELVKKMPKPELVVVDAAGNALYCGSDLHILLRNYLLYGTQPEEYVTYPVFL